MNMDLFDMNRDTAKPLAERMRCESLDDFVAVIIEPIFKADGVDVTKDIYLQLVYENAEDIFNG